MSKTKNLEAKRRLERMPYRGLDLNGKPLRDYSKAEKEIVKEIKREYENSLKSTTK
jgi:ribosome biogenesis protein Tsr3